MEREMSGNEMRELVAAEPRDDAIQDNFPRLGLPEDAISVDWLQNAVQQGNYRCVDFLDQDRKTVYRVWYHKTHQNHFYVNNVGHLQPHKSYFDQLIKGLEKYAKQLGCVGIVYTTKRKSLIDLTREFDFEVAGVTLVKMFVK